MIFEGKFTLPKGGPNASTIALSGPGQCRLTPTGIEINGFGPRRVDLFYLTIFGSLALGAFGFRYAPGISVAGWYGIIGAYCAISAGALLGGRWLKRHTKAVRLSIPWGHVKSVGDDPDDDQAVRLVVQRFKPSGTLWFKPTAGSAEFIKVVRHQLRGS